jgi:hypothetical protein
MLILLVYTEFLGPAATDTSAAPVVLLRGPLALIHYKGCDRAKRLQFTVCDMLELHRLICAV